MVSGQEVKGSALEKVRRILKKIIPKRAKEAGKVTFTVSI